MHRKNEIDAREEKQKKLQHKNVRSSKYTYRRQKKAAFYCISTCGTWENFLFQTQRLLSTSCVFLLLKTTWANEGMNMDQKMTAKKSALASVCACVEKMWKAEPNQYHWSWFGHVTKINVYFGLQSKSFLSIRLDILYIVCTFTESYSIWIFARKPL